MKIMNILLMTLFINITYANQVTDHITGIWSIKSPSNVQQWVVINNIDIRGNETIYHIEVLSRKKSAPLWQIQHLAPHLAVTQKALVRSIIKELHKGAVYPETYNAAYNKWLHDNNNTGGKICTSSIEQCIKQHIN